MRLLGARRTLGGRYGDCPPPPMPALEIELERTPDEPTGAHRQPDAQVESRRPEPKHAHFSPDPSKPTDRYRLVTPYELSSND